MVDTRNIRHDSKVNTTSFPWWYLLLIPGSLSLITFLIYYQSLNYPFQFDDIANISKRFAIRFDNPLQRWITNPRWFGDWLNTLNYQIGRFDPFSYRLINVLIHLFAGLFIFFLVLNLCRFLTRDSFLYRNCLQMASVVSALFLLHPVQTQTVSYVIQARLEGLATLFVLATAYFYTLFFLSRNQVVRVTALMLFFITGWLSCGTKEIVVVIPALLLLIDWFFISQQQWSLFKKRLWLHLLFDCTFIGLVVWYLGSDFVMRAITLQATSGNNRGNILTDHAFDSITPLTYFISEFKVILHYIWIFFFPFNISVEYDWKLASTFFQLDVLLPGIILASMLFGSLFSLITKRNSNVVFGFWWFLISIAPRSTIIPSPEIVCDYKTYLGSFGILFIIGLGIVHAMKQIHWFLENISSAELKRKLNEYITMSSILAVFLIPVCVVTMSRNHVWHSTVSFWEDNALKAPNKARVHNNYGVALSEIGRLDESILAYKKAIDMDKYYQDPLSNIAVAYSLKGDVDKAIESLQQAIHIYPDYPEAYNNIGSLLIQKNMLDEAERMLSMAVKLRPYYGKAYYNLARLYETKNEPEKVLENLKNATKGDLDIPEVFFKLGQMCLKLERWNEAIDAFETTLERGMNNPNVWFNLANAFFMLKQYEKSLPIFERLVRDNPLDARFSYNLAETYFIKNDYQKALVMFRRTSQLPQPLPQAFFRVTHCLERMKQNDQARTYLKELLALDASEDFKRFVQNEITRVDLQLKLEEGKGSIKLEDFKQALAERKIMPSSQNVTRAA